MALTVASQEPVVQIEFKLVGSTNRVLRFVESLYYDLNVINLRTTLVGGNQLLQSAPAIPESGSTGPDLLGTANVYEVFRGEQFIVFEKPKGEPCDVQRFTCYRIDEFAAKVERPT